MAYISEIKTPDGSVYGLKDRTDETSNLAISRVDQEHVTATSLNRCQAYRCNGILCFEGNVDFKYGNGFSDFVQIGKIEGWKAVAGIYTNVPCQDDGSKVVCFGISNAGVITVYSGTGSFSGAKFFRFTASIPSAE